MPKTAIITIHGIHTRQLMSWQSRFADYINGQDKDIKILAYKYGMLLAPFSWWAALTNTLHIPTPFRKWLIRKFCQYISDIQKKFPDYEISIIAHSFGTWMAYNAVECDANIKIKNMVLVQGVLPIHAEDTDIFNLLEEDRLGSVYIWSSHKDNVICKMAIPPFGKCGCFGFVRMAHTEDYTKPALKPYNFEIYNLTTEEDHGGVLRNLDVYGPTLYKQLTT